MNERLTCFSKEPPTPASPVLPPEGEDLEPQIFPLWGKWPEGPSGVLFSCFRFPREGGDPDPFTQAESGPLDFCFRGRGGQARG